MAQDAILRTTARKAAKLNVFISYSRQDIAFVDHLQRALAGHGIEAFVDRDQIEKSEEWWARIVQLINEADTIVFVLSPDSVTSKVCKDEVAFAEKLNKRFVPVVARGLDGYPVPDALARLNYVFFTANPTAGANGDFDMAVVELVRALETDIPWIREHTRLGAMAERWDARKRPKDLLLRGAELTSAETWLTTRPDKAPNPTDAHRALVTLSRRAAARRLRTLVGLSLASVVVASALAGSAFWQRGIAIENESRAAQNERIAQEQRGIAERNENRAVRNFDAARDAVDKIGLFVAKDLRSIVGMPQGVIRTMLLQTEATIDKLVADEAVSKTLLRSRASLLSEFAKTYWLIGDTEKALKAAEDCISIAGTLLASSPKDLELSNILYDANLTYGDVLQVKGDVQGALGAFRQGRSAIEPILDESQAGTESWRRMAWGIDRIGDVLRRQQHFKDAGDQFREAQSIRLRFLQQNPDSQLWLTDLSWGYNRAGDNAREDDDLHPRILIAAKAGGPLVPTHLEEKWTSALSSYNAALAIRRRLVENLPNDSVRQRNLAWSLNLVGLGLLATAQKLEALSSHEEASAILQKLLLNDKENTQWLRDLAITQNYLGDARLSNAQWKSALSHYRRAIQLSEQLASLDRNNSRWKDELMANRKRLERICATMGQSECSG